MISDADLAEYVVQPDRIVDVAIEELPPVLAAIDAAVTKLSSLRAVVLWRMASQSTTHDRLISEEEAARLLLVTPRWLRRYRGVLPFVRHLSSRQVRYSERGLREWAKGHRTVGR